MRDPGDHLTSGAARVRDAVYLAGGLTSDASTDSVQIFRRTGNNKLVVLSVNLQRALRRRPKQCSARTERPPDHPPQSREVHPPTVTIEAREGVRESIRWGRI